MELDVFTITAGVFAANVLFAVFMHGARAAAKAKTYDDMSLGEIACFVMPVLACLLFAY